MAVLTRGDDFRRVLAEARRVVVLGASPTRYRAGFYVPAYLQEQGYDVVGVNPTRAGEPWLGHPLLGSLDEVDGPVDLLDVFRRSDALAGHLDEILRLAPRVVWFQQGVRDDAVAARLAEAGIDVVQDRCTLADHRAFGLGRVG